MPGKMARSDPRAGVRVARGAGSSQHLASVLQDGRENGNIDAGLGFIWRISAHCCPYGIVVVLLKAKSKMDQPVLYHIKWFFKNRIRRGSWTWSFLLSVQRALRKMERLKSHVMHWTLPFASIRNLNRFEFKVYSQNGEDGILQAIFSKIGTTNKYGVEFGVQDGMERNTRYLCEKKGWTCLLMDAGDNYSTMIKKEFITAENINQLFEKYAVPELFDLLCIDIDGNDYWVWMSLDNRYAPRVVVVEYNASIPPQESKAIAYDPQFRWDGSDYFGASLLALTKLASAKGYTLVGCDRQGVNAFFVRNDLIQGSFVPSDIKTLYRPPLYGKKEHGGGFPPSQKRMSMVEPDVASRRSASFVI